MLTPRFCLGVGASSKKFEFKLHIGMPKIFWIAIFFSLMSFFQLSHSAENVDAVPPSADLNAGGAEIAADDLQETLSRALDTESVKKSEPLESQSEPEHTFDRLYAEGVRAYDDQLWYSCATKLEKAIKDYQNYKKVLSDCRLDCKKGVKSSKLASLKSNIPDFDLFSKFLKDADCFRRCTDESLNTHPRVTVKLEDAFKTRKPYQYLQFCYFKLDRLKQAAAAAYTYFLKNEHDTDTRQNIIYYRDRAMVPETDFVDLELVPYKEHYIRAMLAYTEENWASMLTHIEESLVEYYKEHERCQAECEAIGLKKGKEFTTAVADSIISILICKLECEEVLSVVYTEPIDFFLQDMYHYLQFGYFKEDNLEKCAEATASFLLLNSSHEVMLSNKELLKDKLDYQDKDFIPNKEVVDFVAMKKEMHELMDFINKNYRWPDLKEEVEETEDHSYSLKRALEEYEDEDNWMSRYEKLGMHIIAKSTDLDREERFVTDGLLKEEQCEELLTLTKDLKKLYTGARKFDLKLAQEMLEREPDEEYETSLRLFVRAAEVVRHYTQRYIDPEESFYLKQSSIVCWAQPDDPESLTGCYLQEDGTCIKFSEMSDELFSDAFTTVTYLTTADEDADFQFLNENRKVDSSFGVKCGRTVGFNSGDRHTLKVPKNGDQRCAMMIRYTTYRADDEKEYRDTIALLHRVDELRLASAARSAKEVMKKFYEDGVTITKSGKEELKGKERFVADGLASDAQCSTLRNMVLELGKAGDGYSGKKSPHTVNEMFAGLTVDRVAQSGALVGDGYDHLSSKPSFISPHTEHEMYQGITIYRAAKLMHQGMIPTFGLRAFLELSENSRLLVEKYFNLTKPLYFDYTHLVCRTAIDDSKYNRNDLSHPVHADNCVLQPDGSCLKDYPAFTQRDYSAILYLNADFEGGEFFFAHSNETEQVSLRPKCGRLVGFNAGDFHGVRAVKSGQRCALALWFTHNPNFKELAHIQARKTLKQVEEEQRSRSRSEAREDL